MYLVLSVAPGIPANLSIVLFVKSLVICPGPVPSRACAGAASSPVTWPVSVGGLGASLVLRPPRLFRHRHRLCLLSIPSLILFPLRPIPFPFPFPSLIPFLMIRLHLLQPLLNVLNLFPLKMRLCLPIFL